MYYFDYSFSVQTAVNRGFQVWARAGSGNWQLMGLYCDREKAGAKKRQQQMASCILKANTHVKRRTKWRENYLYGVTTTPQTYAWPSAFCFWTYGKIYSANSYMFFTPPHASCLTFLLIKYIHSSMYHLPDRSAVSELEKSPCKSSWDLSYKIQWNIRKEEDRLTWL